MCLEAVKSTSDRKIRALKKSGQKYIEVFKVVRCLSGKRLNSPYNTCYYWEPGWHESNVDKNIINYYCYTTPRIKVEASFHAFLTEKKAVEMFQINSRVLKLKVPIENIVAIDVRSKEIAFSRCFLSKKEYDKAIK